MWIQNVNIEKLQCLARKQIFLWDYFLDWLWFQYIYYSIWNFWASNSPKPQFQLLMLHQKHFKYCLTHNMVQIELSQWENPKDQAYYKWLNPKDFACSLTEFNKAVHIFKCKRSEHLREIEEWIIVSNISFTCCEVFPSAHGKSALIHDFRHREVRSLTAFRKEFWGLLWGCNFFLFYKQWKQHLQLSMSYNQFANTKETILVKKTGYFMKIKS